MDLEKRMNRPTALVVISAFIIAAGNPFSSDNPSGPFLISAAYAKDGGGGEGGSGGSGGGGDNDGGDNDGGDSDGGDNDGGNSGSGSGNSGSGNSGSGKSGSNDGSDDDDRSDRSGKKGNSTKKGKSNAQVRYSNGWVEGIVSGIYTVKDAQNRTVISRKATKDDFERMDRDNNR